MSFTRIGHAMKIRALGLKVNNSTVFFFAQSTNRTNSYPFTTAFSHLFFLYSICFPPLVTFINVS